MSEPTAALPEVYSASEIALAAGVGAGDVLRWAEAHAVEPLPGGFYTTPQAVRMVRHLVATVEVHAAPRALFERADGPRRKRGWPLALTTAVHMGLVAGLALATTAARPSAHRVEAPMTTQLVFLTTPGPGGGGGGGGRKAATPATAAQRKGVSRLRSPIPAPAPERAAPSPVDQPPPQPKPEVIAPVASVAADQQDVAGVPVEAPPQPESRGPGNDGEAGTGRGAGIGAGGGPGIGAGTGGGTGGGPYRPGAGISPPSLLREVKPDYSDEGRRRNIEGEVQLEIVIRSDGSVGDVTLRRGLGAGLDERAVDAVRQWRFSPATRQGVPVDVVVQVSVEFRLR
jgi:TonB family protein